MISEILPVFRRLCQDEQDPIRILCIESLVPIATYLTKEENQVNTLGALLAAAEDKSWKVRLTFAKNFAQIAEAFGKEITDTNLIQTFSNFLNDNEPEVKDAAVTSLTNCLKTLSADKITSYILPSLQTLYEDGSVHFKCSVCKAMARMSTIVGKEITQSKLMPIVLDLIKDENGDVRLESTAGLIHISECLGTDILSTNVTNALS